MVSHEPLYTQLLIRFFELAEIFIAGLQIIHCFEMFRNCRNACFYSRKLKIASTFITKCKQIPCEDKSDLVLLCLITYDKYSIV